MKQLYWLAMLIWPLLLTTAVAQQGTITGTVTQQQTGEALAGVHVFITTFGNTDVIAGDYTDAEGHYEISNVNPGTYAFVTSYIGCKPITQNITIAPDQTLEKDIALDETVITLNEVVVSASRRDEKLVDAPSAITVIPSRDIERHNTLSPTEHLRGVQGVDVQEKGIMANEYAARGLNNVFNGNVRTLTDNRMTNLPALRANIGYLQHITNMDIDRIEMVLGPGSALYGPNVTNGVVHTITKSPFASKGTDITLFGGMQSLLGVAARNAGAITDNLAYKISAQYTTAKDWEHSDNLVEYPSDMKAERYTVDARADYAVVPDGTISLSAGRSVALRAFDLTDNGAVMAKNFSYNYVQGKFTLGNLFAQAYINMNDAGDTYFLPQVGGIADESSRIVDNSSKVVAEIQHSTNVTPWQNFIYGVDAYFTNPRTDGTIMGRNEDDDNVQEFGGYLQSETRLPGNFATLLLAGRIDKHSALDEAVFSPRAGVLVSPSEGHNFRAMYNRAFMTPVISELFLDLQVDGDIFSVEDRFGIQVPGMMYALQNTGVPSSGYHFNRTGGDLWFRSEIDPSIQMPVSQAVNYWQYMATLVASQLPEDMGALLLSMDAPTAEQVRSYMLQLNLEKAQSGDPNVVPFDPVAKEDVLDIPRLRPTILNNYELGYQGRLTDDIQVGASWYYSEYEDFITPGRVITPNVFLNGEDIYGYLYQKALESSIPDEDAMQFAGLIAPIMAEMPLGTVTPEEAKDPTKLIMAPINYGTISYWGSDISLMFNLSDKFSVGTNYSFINKNWYDDVDGKGSLSLNVPKHKAALSLHYTEPVTAIRSSVRYRFNDGFRVKSGIYEGTIDPYGLIDVAVSVPLPVPLRPTLNINVQNALDHVHREYIGGGNIGRLITAGLTLGI